MQWAHAVPLILLHFCTASHHAFQPYGKLHQFQLGSPTRYKRITEFGLQHNELLQQVTGGMDLWDCLFLELIAQFLFIMRWDNDKMCQEQWYPRFYDMASGNSFTYGEWQLSHYYCTAGFVWLWSIIVLSFDKIKLWHGKIFSSSEGHSEMGSLPVMKKYHIILFLVGIKVQSWIKYYQTEFH